MLPSLSCRLGCLIAASYRAAESSSCDKSAVPSSTVVTGHQFGAMGGIARRLAVAYVYRKSRI